MCRWVWCAEAEAVLSLAASDLSFLSPSLSHFPCLSVASHLVEPSGAGLAATEGVGDRLHNYHRTTLPPLSLALFLGLSRRSDPDPNNNDGRHCYRHGHEPVSAIVNAIFNGARCRLQATQ